MPTCNAGLRRRSAKGRENGASFFGDLGVLAGRRHALSVSRVSRASVLTQRLSEAFVPEHLEVINESHMHSVPKGSETHFRVVVAAAAFEGKSRIDRHRAVQRALGDEFRSGLHALTISAFSTSEWAARPEVPGSPECLGGSKADRS